jgi:hypothetical protein
MQGGRAGYLSSVPETSPESQARLEQMKETLIGCQAERSIRLLAKLNPLVSPELLRLLQGDEG